MLGGALLPAAHLLFHTVFCDIILQCAQPLQDASVPSGRHYKRFSTWQQQQTTAVMTSQMLTKDALQAVQAVATAALGQHLTALAAL